MRPQAMAATAALSLELPFLRRPEIGFCRRTQHRRRLLPIASSLQASDNLEEDVMKMFLKERRLDGDFISKISDVLWRRNDLELDILDTSTSQSDSIHFGNVLDDETSGGFLKLKAARDWISGDSVPPVNKKLTVKDWYNESEKRKKLNLLRYQALKGELLLLTIGIGAACTVYCLFVFSLEVAFSYAAGVLLSCLYLQLLNHHADNISMATVPEIFLRKSKRKIGIRSEDLQNAMEKIVGAVTISLSSPRLIIPAAIYGLWAFSNRFDNNNFFHFQLVPAMMGFFAYKAAALVQVYRDNEDLRLIFPDSESVDSS